MFTLEQIKAAHSQVKSGADFPAYIQDMKKLGIARYEHFVSNGHIIYYSQGAFKLEAPARWPERTITLTAVKTQLEQHLHEHQQGHSDYPTFCRLAAEAGIEKWIVDIGKMACTYYDKEGTAVLAEAIPLP